MEMSRESSSRNSIDKRNKNGRDSYDDNIMPS